MSYFLSFTPRISISPFFFFFYYLSILDSDWWNQWKNSSNMNKSDLTPLLRNPSPSMLRWRQIENLSHWSCLQKETFSCSSFSELTLSVSVLLVAKAAVWIEQETEDARAQVVSSRKPSAIYACARAGCLAFNKWGLGEWHFMTRWRIAEHRERRVL